MSELKELSMRIILCSLVISVITAVNGEQRADEEQPNYNVCSPHSVAGCKTEFIEAYRGGEDFLPDEKFLNDYCWSAMSYAHCLDKFTEECAKIGRSSSNVKLAILGKSVTQRLCDKNSRLRADYLAYVPCINRKKAKILSFIPEMTKDFVGFNQYFIGKDFGNQRKQKGHHCLIVQLGGEKLVSQIEENCRNEVPSSASGVLPKYLKEVTDLCSENDTFTEEAFQAFRVFKAREASKVAAEDESQTGTEDPDNGCNSEILAACNLEWVEEYEKYEGFFFDEKFLDDNCWSFIQFIPCLDKYRQSCALPEIGYLMQVGKDIGQRLCDKESELRADYLAYVPCINRIEPEIIQSIDIVYKDVSKFHHHYVDQYDNWNKVSGFKCLLLQLIGEGAINRIEAKCKDEVPDSASGTLSKYFKEFTDTCSGNDTYTQEALEAYRLFMEGRDQVTEKNDDRNIDAVIKSGQTASDSTMSVLENVCPNKWEDAFRQSELIVPDTNFFEMNCDDITKYTGCTRALYSFHRDIRPGMIRHNIPAITNVLYQLCHKEKTIVSEYTKVEGCINRLRNNLVRLEYIATGDVVYVDMFRNRRPNLYESSEREVNEGLPCTLKAMGFDSTYKLMKEHCGAEVESHADGFFPKFIKHATEKCELNDDGWLKLSNGTTLLKDSTPTSWKCGIDVVVPCRLKLIKDYFRGQVVPPSETLDGICEDLMPDFSLITTYDNACADYDYNTKDDDLMCDTSPTASMKNLKELFQNLCDKNSTLRKDYDKYAVCVSKHQRSIKELIMAAALETAEFWKFRRSEKPHDLESARALRCVIREVHEPLFLDIVKKCGDQSADYFLNLLDLLFEPMAEYCPGEYQMKETLEEYKMYKEQAKESESV